MNQINSLRQQIFQFQYGSIKRFVPLLRFSALRYFNSNMVRLKDVQNYKNHSENKGI